MNKKDKAIRISPWVFPIARWDDLTSATVVFQSSYVTDDMVRQLIDHLTVVLKTFSPPQTTPKVIAPPVVDDDADAQIETIAESEDK